MDFPIKTFLNAVKRWPKNKKPTEGDLYLRLYRLADRHLGLKSQIYLAAAATFIAVSLYLGSTLYAQQSLAAATHEILDARIVTMHAALQAKRALAEHDAFLFRYLATLNRNQLLGIGDLRTMLREEIQQLLKYSDGPYEKQRIRELQKQSEAYFLDTDRLLKRWPKDRLPPNPNFFVAANWARDRGLRQNELDLLSEKGRMRMLALFSLCDELVTINRVAFEEAQKQMNVVLRRSKETAIVAGLAVAGMTLLVAVFLAVSILGPLRALLEGVHRIEREDLDFQIPVTRADEIGQLTRAFNQMTQTVRQQRERLKYETITDGLTGAYNQRHFRQLLRQEVDRARRADQSVSLLMIDVDHFKTYNDSQGHEYGNELLKRLCLILRENLRDSDSLARYGGDELAIILPDTPPDAARLLTEKLREALLENHFPGEGNLPAARVTMSIGGASYPDDARSANNLVRKADEALYAAKLAGRDCLRWSAIPLVAHQDTQPA